MVNDIIRGTLERDYKIASNCMHILMLNEKYEAYEEFQSLFQQFDIQQRKMVDQMVCNIVQDHPTAVGVKHVLWLIINDKNPSVIVRAISSILKVYIKLNEISFLSKQLNFLLDYKTLFEIIRKCLAFLKHDMPNMVSTSMYTINNLICLRVVKEVIKKDRTFKKLFKEIAINARALLHNPETKVKACACFTLANIGEQGDIKLLSRLRSQSKSPEVREYTDKAIKILKQKKKYGAR